jgi:hypothetical protein
MTRISFRRCRRAMQAKKPMPTKSKSSGALIVVLPVVVLIVGLIALWQSNLTPVIQTASVTKMDPATVNQNKAAAKEMFYFAYDNYLQHAFPKDELAPISCTGHDTENCRGCLLTFYDALDTLAVLGNRTEFQVSAANSIPTQKGLLT